MPNTAIATTEKQRGAVLIVALVLLLVLTILGTASIQDTAMEERMAGNFRDYTAALEAAESALRTGEDGISVSSVFNLMLFDGSDGTYTVSESSNSVDPATAANYGWTIAGIDLVFREGGSAGNDLLVSAVPEIYIEKLPEIALPESDLTVGFQDQAPRVRYHRVTSKGYGISPNSEVILQSTYFR